MFAALVPALAFALSAGSIVLATYVIVVTLANVFLGGLPLGLLFYWRRWAGLLPTLAVGFLLGAIPMGIYSVTGSLVDHSKIGGVDQIVGGRRTLAGWLGLFEFLGVLGL